MSIQERQKQTTHDICMARGISQVTSPFLSQMPRSNESAKAPNPQTQSMQHQAVDPNLWQQLTQLTLSNSDLETTLSKTATALGEAFGIDNCLIALKTEQESYQSFCWSATPNSFPSQSVSLLLENSGVKSLLRGTTPLVVSDTHTTAFAEELQILLPQAPQVQAILGTKIFCQDYVDGVIILMRSHPHHWIDSEIQGLEAISEQVAVAITHICLHQQKHKQSQYRAVVNQLTMAIRNSVGLNQILKQAIDGAAQALQVDRGIILRLKYWDSPFKGRTIEQLPKARATVVYEWSGTTNSEDAELVDPNEAELMEGTDSLLHRSFWLSECHLCQQVLIHTRPLVVNDKAELSTEPLTTIAPIFDLDTRPSLLLVPLESQNTVLGFMALQHNQPHTWQLEELELVELVSAQISTAILQTETLRQVQALVDKRTVQLRQSLELQSKLYEKTRQQIDQLRHLNQLKDEFIDTISHELRTPLTSMTLAIRMLRNTGLSNQQSSKYLDILEQQCAQEISLVNDLLALQELESRQVAIQLEDVDLQELIEELTRTFQQRWATKGLSLELDLPHPLTLLRTDLNSLRSILQELLMNAGKYSDPNTVATLQVTVQRQQPINQVIVKLSNIGPGISPEELPHIFEKFRRGQGATQNAIQGTGLGLALVKSLVQHLNGTIDVTSGKCSDREAYTTCFTLTLPQSLESPRL